MDNYDSFGVDCNLLGERIWEAHVEWKKGEIKKEWNEIGEGERRYFRHLALAAISNVKGQGMLKSE